MSAEARRLCQSVGVLIRGRLEAEEAVLDTVTPVLMAYSPSKWQR
jgi:hypothetical protein